MKNIIPIWNNNNGIRKKSIYCGLFIILVMITPSSLVLKSDRNRWSEIDSCTFNIVNNFTTFEKETFGCGNTCPPEAQFLCGPLVIENREGLCCESCSNGGNDRSDGERKVRYYIEKKWTIKLDDTSLLKIVNTNYLEKNGTKCWKDGEGFTFNYPYRLSPLTFSIIVIFCIIIIIYFTCAVKYDEKENKRLEREQKKKERLERQEERKKRREQTKKKRLEQKLMKEKKIQTVNEDLVMDGGDVLI